MASMPRLRITINILILILAFSLVLGKALAEEVELKYDDGSADGSWSIYPLYHVVSFSPPSTPWVINKIKIHGKGYGDFSNKEIKVEIWEVSISPLLGKNVTRIYYADTVRGVVFSSKSAWVDIPLKEKVEVSKDFYVAIDTDSTQDSGIYISLDESRPNNNSYIFTRIPDRKEKYDWSWSPGLKERKDKLNWMIRVVGSTPSPPPTTTPAPTTPPPTTTQPPTTTPAPTTPAPTTAPPITQAPAETPAPAKGICGPTLVALIAVLLLFGYGWLRNKRR